MDAKICGIKDPQTLKYIINHKYPPKFVGFIVNYKKSKRYIDYKKLKKLIRIKKKKVKFVAVLVNPNNYFLEKIKNLNFDYYQLYKVSPRKTKNIKKKYKMKIISTITVDKKNDVEKYKKYLAVSDIILFDSKGYEKSLSFNHRFLNNMPNIKTKMLAGNIKFNDKLDKYSKIADIIDISGSLETFGTKDISKINFFLNNINKTKNEN
tara:strand:- start:1763 stop:2386 length:624 start_codon:yes stop_codon:yes gene_type:complete